jgi:hypothetical protein
VQGGGVHGSDIRRGLMDLSNGSVIIIAEISCCALLSAFIVAREDV